MVEGNGKKWYEAGIFPCSAQSGIFPTSATVKRFGPISN